MLYALVVLVAVSTYIYYIVGLKVANAYATKIGGVKKLNTLPKDFGYLAASSFIACFIALALLWFLVLQQHYINLVIVSKFPQHLLTEFAGNKAFLISQISNASALQNADSQIVAASHIYKQSISDLKLFSIILILVVSAVSAAVVCYRMPLMRSVRHNLEKFIKALLICCSVVAIFTTIGIVLSVLFEAIKFFKLVSIFDFLFGTKWSPQTALRSDQVASAGSFGSLSLFIGTLQISLLAMLIAVPIGLFSAIYLAEYASKQAVKIIKPILEILAGIPTVVYGFFAALTLGPSIRNLATSLGISSSSESMLATGIIMGIMIVPFISSLSHDIINAVPQSLRDGSFAVGSTKSEMIKKVLIPAALPGIVSSILLAMSRAIGETMIVVMAAGLTANLTMNPFDSVTTVTVQIVSLLVGDQEFSSAKTLSAFALGLVLFIITLILNIIALRVVKRYREIYS